jgi:hypothetical protein
LNCILHHPVISSNQDETTMSILYTDIELHITKGHESCP